MTVKDIGAFFEVDQFEEGIYVEISFRVDQSILEKREKQDHLYIIMVNILEH